MKRIHLTAALFLGCLFCSPVMADIYVWTDDEGVKHFTNYAPPAHAKVLSKTQEIPYDEEADNARREAEIQQNLVSAMQEIAEKEALLAEMQREAEQRIAEANRKADEMLQRAETLLNASENYGTDSDSAGRYVSYGYYPYFYYRPPHYTRWYYRKGGNVYYKNPHLQRHRYNGQYHKRIYYKNHLRGFERRAHQRAIRSGRFSARFAPR